MNKKDTMKNEPVVSYNHMEEDEANSNTVTTSESVPFSLYMLLIVDAVLISGLAIVAAKVIF